MSEESLKMLKPYGCALVTGGAQRIGRAISLRLARDGWPVVIHFNQSVDQAEETAREINNAGGQAWTVSGDLSESAASQSILPEASMKAGQPITCLINNASIFEQDRAINFASNDFDRNMAIHARAPAELAASMVKNLPDSLEGNIINLLDQKSFNPDSSFFSYSISKFALLGLTQTLAVSLAPRIRVNGIALGMTLPPPGMSQARFTELQRMTLLERGASPTDVAEAASYLTRANFVTGEVIAVDGGERLSRSKQL
jgi:NAD(P)-dependent dehydrogenase (short-subunit alcohol dehydrogenase family)